MHLGYTMLCEQAASRQLDGDLVRAEETGFDFSVTSDHGRKRSPPRCNAARTSGPT